MTVQGTTSRVEFICVGATVYPLGSDFLFIDDEELIVVRIDSLGVESILVLNTDYTVTGGDSATGSVTTIATYSDGELLIYRETDAVQKYDAEIGDGFNTDTFEQQLDRNTMLIQEQARDIARAMALDSLDTSGASLIFPPESDPTVRAGLFAGFDSAGNLVATGVVGDIGSFIVTWINTALAIVQRDSNGDFAARAITALTFIGNLTGNVTGNANTATLATTATKHGVGGNALNVKTIDIGDWDMVATPGVSVVHGLDRTKIRSVQCIIRDDVDAESHTIPATSTSGTVFEGWISTISATTVLLSRRGGGDFDNTNFDSTSYNRGWITIWYED